MRRMSLNMEYELQTSVHADPRLPQHAPRQLRHLKRDRAFRSDRHHLARPQSLQGRSGLMQKLELRQMIGPPPGNVIESIAETPPELGITDAHTAAFALPEGVGDAPAVDALHTPTAAAAEETGVL